MHAYNLSTNFHSQSKPFTFELQFKSMAKNIVSFSDATIAQDGKTILTNVSVDVPEGSFVFLIGRTGSGKSSLIKTIYADLELAGGLGSVGEFDLTRLKNKQIPLFIKSFLNPRGRGTQVSSSVKSIPEIPSFIIKENQILISISDTSLSFIVEMHMSKIFSLLAKHGVSVNLMQNSAVSFSICVDDDKYKIPALITDLRTDFEIFYNKALSLCTIRHYANDSVDDFVKGKEVLLEQRSRSTLQLVLKDN